jgi:integrase
MRRFWQFPSRREGEADVGLYRRGKTWWMNFMATGKQICESTFTSNKTLARKILDKRKGEIAEGRFSGLLKSHPPTLKDYISKYLESRTDLHPNTRTRYGGSKRFLEEFFAAARLPDITDARIEDYKTARLRGGMGPGPGPAGVNRDLALLRLVLKQARRERYIAQNPLDNRDHFLDERKGKVQARPFTIDEEQRLLAVAKGYLRPLILLLLDTGLRPNAEALALRWKDFDFVREMISVISSKTPAGLRTVPMTSRLKEELLRWKKLTGPQNSQFVFFYPQDSSKHLLHVRKSWAHALKDANVAKRRLYDCRSTFCSRMYAAGIQPVLIELLMGHAGGLVHAYAKADDDFKRDAAAKLEAFITSKIPAESTSTASSSWVN